MGIASPYLRADMIALTIDFACLWDRVDQAHAWSLAPHVRQEAGVVPADRMHVVLAGVNVPVETCDPQLGRGVMRTGGRP